VFIVGQHDHLAAAAAQPFDDLDRHVPAMAIVAAQRVIDHHCLLSEARVRVQHGEEKGEGERGLVPGRQSVAE